MAITGLLAVLAILVASYSVMSDEKRLDVQLRLSRTDFAVFGGAIVAILVIVYSPVLLQFGISSIPFMPGFGPDTTSLLFQALILVYAGVQGSRRRLSRTGLSRWCAVSVDCLHSGRYRQLAYLLDRYNAQLFAVVEQRIWYESIHRFFAPPTQIEILMNVQNPESDLGLGKRAMRLFNWHRKFVAGLFPARSRDRDEVRRSISRLLIEKPFVAFLAKTKPMLAARATSLPLIDRNLSMGYMFESLLTDHYGALSVELRDCNNTVFCDPAAIVAHKQLLSFFLQDVSFARKIGVWKPVGDFLTRFTRKQRGKDNYYNQRSKEFSSGNERWGCPIFLSIRFFDVMVTTAICRGVKNHMWLMYLAYCLDIIIENIDRADDADDTDEFPVVFDYLVYECITTCASWLSADLPIDNSELTLYQERGSPDHDERECERRPRWWAAKVLGGMLRKIVQSENFSHRKKVYFFEVILQHLSQIEHKNLSSLTILTLESCVEFQPSGATNRSAIVDLMAIYRDVDHVLKGDNQTFDHRLNALISASSFDPTKSI
jgi:hypothetical protein